METTTFRWKGRFGPFDLAVAPTTFVPSTISTLLAGSMEIHEGDVVIDVGSGTGILGIVAAKLGAGRVIATDRSPDADTVGNENARRLGVADRIEFFRGNLFESIPPETRADVVLGDVSGIPDDLAAESGWFPDGVGGGPTGAELPIRMLGDALDWIRRGGRLFLPTGSLQDESRILEAARSLYRTMEKISERIIPLPAQLAESPVVRRLAESGIVRLAAKGSRQVWEARVWRLVAP